MSLSFRTFYFSFFKTIIVYCVLYKSARKNLEFMALKFECTDPQKSYFLLTQNGNVQVLVCRKICLEITKSLT